MVDSTVLGVAGLGVVGTLGAGLIGFAGPSWNEQRIQRARDKREARRALRVIAFEVFDQTTRLEQLAEAVEHKDRVQALQYVIGNLPDTDPGRGVYRGHLARGAGTAHGAAASNPPCEPGGAVAPRLPAL